MRISDWSSDVCSSDLAGRAAAGDARAATVIGGHAFAQFAHDALGGLLADARDADERGHLAGLHQARELVDAGARPHRQRALRADAAAPLPVPTPPPLRPAPAAEHRNAFLLPRVVGYHRHSAHDRRSVAAGAPRPL